MEAVRISRTGRRGSNLRLRGREEEEEAHELQRDGIGEACGTQGKKGDAYMISAGKPEGRRPLR